MCIASQFVSSFSVAAFAAFAVQALCTKQKDYLIELNTWKKTGFVLWINQWSICSLNDDQTVPTTAEECDGTLGLQMIAMEVARNNDHVYTLGNYCACYGQGATYYAAFGRNSRTSCSPSVEFSWKSLFAQRRRKAFLRVKWELQARRRNQRFRLLLVFS